jgi:hypothetical protein
MPVVAKRKVNAFSDPDYCPIFIGFQHRCNGQSVIPYLKYFPLSAEWDKMIREVRFPRENHQKPTAGEEK